MHIIYIDVLIFTNIFQDFMLLLILKKVLQLKASYFRLLLGGLAGGVTSLLALLPTLNFFITLLINAIVAFILVFIAFGLHDKRSFIKNSASLFMLSFLVNGALICFYLAVKPNGMAVINNKVYFDISPLLLIILTLLIYFILWSYKRLFKNHVNSYETVIVSVILKRKEFIIKCKIDSGCNVKEPFSGNYVIIIDESQLEDAEISKENMRVIPFQSLGGNGIIYGFKADEVKISNKKLNKDVYIGLCTNIFKNDFKGLVPKNLLED